MALTTGKSSGWRAYFLGLLTAAAAGALVAGTLYLAEMVRYPRQTPLPPSAANLTAAAHTYVADCAFCHGLPGRPRPNSARGLFPAPPQFFQQPDTMATGLVFYRIRKGLRLTAMPGFGASLSDDQIWQLALLLNHAANLPPAVQSVLRSAPAWATPGAPAQP